MTMLNLRESGIEDLIGYLRKADNQDLYLVNTSDVGGRKKRTEILFNVEDTGGRSVSVALLDTFLPINVGTKVDKLSSFARSDSFLKLIALKYVTAVDDEAARKFLLSPEALEEQRRIFDTSANDLDAFALDEELLLRVETGNKREQKALSRNQFDANPKIVAIMLNATMDEGKKLSALRNVQSEIKQKDVAFIMQHAQDERIKSWAQNLRFSAAT